MGSMRYVFKKRDLERLDVPTAPVVAFCSVIGFFATFMNGEKKKKVVSH